MRSVTVALALGLLTAGLVPAVSPAAVSGRYGGSTTDGRAISFRVSGNRVSGVRTRVHAFCAYTGEHAMRFSPSRTFMVRGGVVFSGRGERTQSGIAIRGRLRGLNAEGTLTRRDSYGPNPCRGGAAWTARRRGA